MNETKMSELYILTYCSHNLISGGEEATAHEVEQILAVSRRNNQESRITGALLYNAGSFGQILEGPRAAVERTFEAIQCDPRHGDVMILHAGPVAHRSFPEWSMAFVDAKDGVQAPAAMAALEAVLAGKPGAGDQIVATLKKLVVEEGEWATLL